MSILYQIEGGNDTLSKAKAYIIDSHRATEYSASHDSSLATDRETVVHRKHKCTR